jgi:hypothetical protein
VNTELLRLKKCGLSLNKENHFRHSHFWLVRLEQSAHVRYRFVARRVQQRGVELLPRAGTARPRMLGDRSGVGEGERARWRGFTDPRARESVARSAPCQASRSSVADKSVRRESPILSTQGTHLPCSCPESSTDRSG